ncbi:MAG: methyltransferase type 11 [Acidobacteria bacterium]|nr:methyltransferase type 11 [Acidobacteriota bacterium]
MVSERVQPAASPTLDEVRSFWESSPLFVGEGSHPTGSREWFAEHERVYMEDCLAGSPSDIFTRDLDPNGRTLDVGCGPGFWVRYLARHGFTNLEACDLTQAAVDLTVRSLEIFGLSARVRVGNAEDLPYETGSIDHINCQGVIHHTPQPTTAIREFSRVLRPAGTLCLSVYRRNFLLRHPGLLRLTIWLIGRVVRLRGRGRESMLQRSDAEQIVRMYDGEDNPLGRAYTPAQLRQMVSEYFEVDRVEYFFFPARALPVPIPAWLHRWLSRRLGLLTVIRARNVATR